MSELTRTCVYVVIGVAALGVGWMSRPAAIQYEKLDDSGERFFAQFDPLEAKSLEIVSVNPENLSLRAFKVAQQYGRWVIPSKAGYPADAQDHLARAATSVMDVEKGTVVSDNAADHELYGVGDPTAASAPSAGAGMRVTLQDGAGKALVDLIFGKPVKDSQNLRFARVPGRDRVYTAAVTTDALTTKFEDWIERDLLQLDAANIKEVILDDYSIDEMNQRIVRGDKLALRHDQATNAWNMEGLREGESLLTPKLEELRYALDDLQIVDVHRKPAGLSSQLQTEESMQIDADAVNSLMSRGYYIVNGALLSNEGETIVHTRDGMEYTLRFGEIVNFDAGTAGGQEPSAEETDQRGRFLFVTVHFDPALVEQPAYDAVPEPATQPDPPSDPTATQPTDDPMRQAIVQANETKRREYEKKLAEGPENAKKLSARFADWYYVVSDAVYQQIRLKRSDVVGPADGSASPAAPGQ